MPSITPSPPSATKVLRANRWPGRLAGAALVVLATLPLAAQEGPRVVRGLSFQGNRSIDDNTLSVAIGTTNSSWFARSPLVRWMTLGEKRYFDEVEFRRDVLRLMLFYRQSGFLEVKVDTVVRRKPKEVSITFKITEGEPVRVTRFAVEGIDSLRRRKDIVVDLPLRVGMPFNRFLFQASADTIAQRLQDRGYPSAEVFRNFNVNKDARTAELSLEAVPGTPGRVGGVSVEGSEKVDSSFIRDLLTLRPGQRYSERELGISQRKLYETELFRYATVDIDSTGFQPGDSVVPLKVRVSEGKSYRVRSSVGYATNDCFRAGAGLTDRNLFGTGRLLDLSARVSKLGVGRPFDFQLGNSICKAVQEDTIGSSLANYEVTATLRQPRLFSPRNVGTYTLFSERRSEFKVYRRDEIGASWSVTRTTARNIPVTVGYRLSYGNTTATAGTFCAFFNACTPTDIGRLREKRLFALAGVSVLWPRVNNPIDPTRGHNYSLEAALSSKYFGSASFQQFGRLTADAAWYRQLRPGVVLSWHLRGGAIVSPRVSFDSSKVNFIPPEQRYYAGGPNDVRGFERNELGPVVYVASVDSITPVDTALAQISRGELQARFSPTGGNTLGIAQVELRVPSPIFGQRMRLAAFVDAGTLFERGKTSISPATIKITPGFGLRIATPLGPARLDIAYNHYDRAAGALYLQRPDGTLILAQNSFAQPRSSRWVFHFAVGQPF